MENGSKLSPEEGGALNKKRAKAAPATIASASAPQTKAVQKLRPAAVPPLPSPPKNGEPKLPFVYDFLDYREFLKALQAARKNAGLQASSAYFARKGGIDSPNYWGLVLSGKRNLSQQSVQKFCRAASLETKEALYFETLVFFNQAQSGEQKRDYFERLKVLIQGHKSSAFDLLESQIEALSHWYVIAIRELVSTRDFQEEATWITRRLRHKITARQAREAIDVLLRAGFLVRNPKSARLEQNQVHLVYREKGANFAIRALHQEFLGRAAESLQEDPVEVRNFSSSTITFDSSKFDEIKKELIEFVEQLSRKYGDKHENADSVIQLNSQLSYLTELPTRGSQPLKGKT
jgi:uncharacterized protein (TIGR02147 family)